MKDFISNFKTTVIGSLDEKGNPFSSYAPFIYHDNKFYIYISDIATHAKNIKAHENCSLFFIEDESKTENLFARKRISLQGNAKLIKRGSETFETLFTFYHDKFDSTHDKMVEMLKKMEDFNLFEITISSGEATFGFGEAYIIGGENMNELIARTGGSGHHKK
jgi:putative heme iron utilization protein